MTNSKEQRSSIWRQLIFLLSLIAGLVAIALTFRKLDIVQLRQTIQTAHLFYVALGLLSIYLTAVGKAYRWQLLFVTQPPWKPIWSSLMIGQAVNLLIPIRLGELSRIYLLSQKATLPKTEILGTLIVEKTLDLITLITLLFFLPLALITQFVANKLLWLTAVGFITLLLIYIATYKGDAIVAILTPLIQKLLPTPISSRLLQLINGTLSGLQSLRNHQRTAQLVLLSIAILILSISTPAILFYALDLPLGWAEAAILHLVLTVGSAPPSTPGKIGVFEWLVVGILTQITQLDEYQMLGYALIYHFVVLLPPVLLGSVAAIRSRR